MLPDFTLFDFLLVVPYNPLSLFLVDADGEDDHSSSLTAACGGPCSLSHSFLNFTMPVVVWTVGGCVLLSLLQSGAGAGVNDGDDDGDVPLSNGGGGGGPPGGGIAHDGDAPFNC